MGDGGRRGTQLESHEDHPALSSAREADRQDEHHVGDERLPFSHSRMFLPV